MTRAHYLVALGAGILVLFVWTITASRIAAAHEDVREARSLLLETSRLVQLVGNAQATGAVDSDVMTPIRQALADCQLPVTALASLRNRGSGAARRTDIRLTGLRNQDIARWYAAFRTRIHGWKAEEISIRPATPAASDNPNMVDADLVLTSAP